jgi:hypothetical protein
MRRATLILSLALAACGVGLPALAAAGGDMTIAVDETRRIELHGTAATIVVGDPAVADVTVSDAHSLVLIGRGFGVTHLQVADRAGRTLLDGRVNVVPPDEGHITYYRGAEAAEYACGGVRCREVGKSDSSGSSGAALPGAGPASTGGVQPVNPSL